MPRKQYLADLEAAATSSFPNITGVARGEDDNAVALFVPAHGSPIEVNMNTDPSLYPSSHTFMMYTGSSDVPQTALDTLQRIEKSSRGMILSDLLAAISNQLQVALAAGARNNPLLLDDDSDVEMFDTPGDEDQEGDEEEDFEDDYGDGYDSDLGFEPYHETGAKGFTSATLKLSPEVLKQMNKRIRQDLRTARYAGFSVGILGGMKADSMSCLLSLSIRISKLGLSEEAVQAWDLHHQQYFVLLLRYSSGYKTFEAVIQEPAKSLDVEFRVGVCNKYKPSFEEALATFTEVTNETKRFSGDVNNNDGSFDTESATGFSNLFISSSLNEFINTRFVSLLKIRKATHTGWDGAKRYFNDRYGRWDEQSENLPETYFQESSMKANPISNSKLLGDHLTDPQAAKISFPLIAAQFALRRLLRCTDFCLVCHDLIEEDFEALKPYVCSKPLCLYQYMSLGFGPSVEHEILTQPYVVDLLVSFCYAAAMNRKLREYPTGMSLSVPQTLTTVTTAHVNHYGVPPPPATTTANPAETLVPDSPTMDVKFDAINHEIIFEDGQTSCLLHNGDWVVLTGHSPLYEHRRVQDISLFPTVKLSSVGVVRDQYDGSLGAPANIPDTPATTPPPTWKSTTPAKMAIYNENFDDMTDVQKAETIVMLIETLPPILELRAYLLKQSKRSIPSLKAWKDRITPAALGMLRWIIASNRSCIVQVDKVPGQAEDDGILSKVKLDQRISNVTDNWVQFRFAQGSPDKEQRFLKALKDEQANLDANHPTLFAFHGSPVQNWHSIIRAGLDFNEVANGRAYGNGIYHAKDQSTSCGYAQPNMATWRGSALKISSAMSVNEIVNCPDRFTSKQPYLVVQHIDWVQCRYLLVSSTHQYGQAAGGTASRKPDTAREVKQDPKYTATSTMSKALGIPLCAVAMSQTFMAKSKIISPNNKRRKETFSTFSLMDHPVSDGESPSDIDFLVTDDEMPVVLGKGKAKDYVNGTQLTDFVPGSLDQSTLPMINPPSYATATATKTLQRALKEILAVQNKTPLHELGWYINPDMVSNVYQWIVELHSFEQSIPLASEMKAAGMTSVVLEIRFGKDYPFSPPFVRVIRPRFLPFMLGGGGHVTAGGAMCMELLTNSGWSSVSSIESVLLQVRMAIMSTEPKPARLESKSKSQQHDYGSHEAIDAFIRACRTHGWAVPPGFGDFSNTVAGPS